MSKKLFKILTPICLIVLTTPVILAATPTDSNPLGIKTTEDIINILKNIVTFMYRIFFIAATGFILWAAFTYLMAGQDAKKVEQAKDQLKYAVIAIVVALVAGGASLIIESFLKVSGS